MRKVLIALTVAILPALPTLARESDGGTDYLHHGVYAGYSLKASSNVFARTLQDTYDFSGVLNVGYEYRPFKKLGVGADIGWLKNVGEHRDQIDYPGGVSLPTSAPYRDDIFMISAGVRGIWVALDHFSLYSTIRAGVALNVENRACTNMFNLLIIPVGVELGFRRVGVYAEYVTGTISTVSFGARVHF